MRGAPCPHIIFSNSIQIYKERMVVLKKFISVMVTLAVILAVLPVNMAARAATAGMITKKFDLGGKGAASGYIGVSATEAYDSKKGYGFENTKALFDVDAAGKGALSDAVRFRLDTAGHVFNVDLPKGVYKITVTTGNVESATITAEGIHQLYFLTGNNATDSFTIPVTDGQLNIYPTSGTGAAFSLSAIEIEQTSTDTVTKPTIWTCGDSTVASYYNVPDDYLRGWGEFLNRHVDMNKYDVRNISASGLRSADLKRSLFPTVEYYGKEGDILLLSVGINDYIDELKAHPDALDSSEYVKNMTAMVKTAKSKGMKVYLVKQHSELTDCSTYPVPTKKWFSDEIDSIAKSENVGIIDLFHPWLEFCLENTRKIASQYYHNNLHPNALGADKMAEIIAGQLFPVRKSVTPTPTDIPDTPSVVYETEISGGPVANPHKGYVINFYNPDMLYSGKHPLGIDGEKNNRAWDVCTICSGVMFWEDLNPAEGVYNFDEIDRALEACEQAGRTYGIRIIPYTTSKGSDDNYGAEHDFVPQWVYDKGAKQDLTSYKYKEGAPQIKVPNWSDPIYIQAYKDFTKALADRYNGDPRVEYVEIRAFGNMGEWHTSEFIGNEMPSSEIQKDMLSYFASVFPDTTCCALSDVRGDVYEHAIKLGIAKRNNGLVMGPNEEWDLRPAYKANVMTMGDNHNSYENMLNPKGEGYLKWTPEHYREVIEIAHLSIYSLDMDSTTGYQIYLDQKPLIDEMCNRLGYNFTVTSAASYGNKLVVKIKNTGLASCFFNIDLCAEITDADGNKISNFGSPIRIEKASFHDGEEKVFVFENEGESPADATLCLAMYDCDNPLVAGKDPTVKFDNKNNLPNNRLKLVVTQVNNTDPSNPGGTVLINDPNDPNVPSVKPSQAPAVVTTIPAPANSEETQKISDFVARLYKYVLNREYEKDGLTFWTNELYSFNRSGAEVGLQFIFSDEFISRNTSDPEFVTILYKTFFGREPEEEGFNFWTSSLKNGTLDRMGVALGFVYSQEWANTCASYGIRSGGDIKPTVAIEPTDLTYAFVERMYTTAMKRGSDKEGKEYWANELSNFNCTGEFVGLAFFLSDEMNGFGLSNKEFVTRLYKTFMDREPEKDGLDYWVTTLGNGSSRMYVVYGFTRSEEFINKCVEARILPY